MVSIVKKPTLTDPVRGVPTADRAFVFYRDDKGYCAATEHQVRNGKLGLGRVVSMRNIGDRFARITDAGAAFILPESVFVSTQNQFAWVSPARQHPMWFRVNSRHWAHRVWWPHLLWIADKRRRRLKVFALGSKRRPTMNTIVYHAPLMNIGVDGSLCEGSARLPRRLSETVLSEIEACVYDSNFTHVNHDHTLRAAPDNRAHIAYWREKERSGNRVKTRELIRVGRLAEVIR